MVANVNLYLLLLPLLVDAQPYGRSERRYEHTNKITDPILTPIINWFDLYNEQESPQFAESIDDANSVTTIPKTILRSFNLYPAMSTTTPAPNFMDQFLKPFFEPFQREMETNRVRQILSKPQQPRNQAFAAPTMNVNKQSPLSNLLESIGMNAVKPMNSVQIGKDKTINILGMDVGQKDGIMLSPLKGLSLGKQNLFGPVAIHDDYKIGWDFLDNIGSMFAPKRQQ